MTVRIPWDNFEVALLFRSYERVASGADLANEAEALSRVLRDLAVRRGVTIDETYRNVNGMKMQLANAQYIFTNGKKGLSGASAMIRQMYDLYRDHPTEYQSILMEAIRMTGNQTTSVQDAFFAYVKDKIYLPPKMVADYLQKAADYCQLKQPLLGMTDVKAVRNVQQKVAEGKSLQFRFGKEAKTLRKVTQLYYTFIKGYREPKEDNLISPAHAVETVAVTQDIVDTCASASESAPALSLDEAAHVVENGNDDGRDEEEADVGNKETPTVSTNDPLMVDFSRNNSYLFTKPVTYTYKGQTYSAKSWNRIYVEICGLLFADHHDAFMSIMNGDIPGNNSLAYADEQHKSGMRVARHFSPGYYLESNIDATTIVRRIRGLYHLFDLGDGLRISYTKTRDTKPVTGSVDSGEEWIIRKLRTLKIPFTDHRAVGSYLWIASDMSIPISLKEADERGYRLWLKQDGCPVYPNRPVLWTKDQPKNPINTADFRRRLDEKFKPYLLSEKKLAAPTAGQYSQSVEAVERFILERNLGCTLDTADPGEAQHIYDMLLGRKDFVDWNNRRHHQYGAALAQYVGYLRKAEDNGGYPYGGNDMTIKEAAAKVLQEAEMALTLPEIMRQIEAEHLYKFNSSNPLLILYQGIRRYCKNMKAPNHAPVDVFERFTDEAGQIRYKLISEQPTSVKDSEVNVQTLVDDRWHPILQDSFPDGYMLDDFLSQFQAAAFWQERYGEECPIHGEAIDAAMKAVGEVRDGRVFTKSEEDKELIATICSEINAILSQYTTVYRSCIYDRYQEELASIAIYTEPVMTQQLLAEANGSFYSVNQVFVRCGQYASVNQDARRVLRDHGGPMPVDDMAKVLWFIPRDMIYHYLSVDDESLNIGNSTWMLAEHFPVTRDDADRIGNMLDEYFLTNNYVQAFDLMTLLRNRLPGIADNLGGMNYQAIFNIVQYYLRNRFNFTKAIISPKGTSIDFTDLFRAFSAERDTFTLADLEALANELKLPIYWESTYAGGAVRVSKTDFVNRRLIQFDVDAIDAALVDFCPGDYLPLMSISSAMMMHLPSCGYQWNGYLLQSYVNGFSKTFRLSYSSFGKNGYYGAMVRRSCESINNYGSLIERVLTDDEAWETTADALDLLVKRGYQALRKYKEIDNVVAQAKRNKLPDDGR